MRGTLLTLPCLVALVLAGCSKPGSNRETGAVGGAADTSTMQPSSTVPSDTAPAGAGAIDTTRRDTSPAGAGALDTGRSKSGMSDSAKSNQSKSGVTNTKTGQSTLGPGVKKTRPDQGQPVTSKGDTISGRDSTSDSAR